MKAARNLGLVVVIAALMAFTADRVFARPCCENCDDPNGCAELCEGDPACTQECQSHAMACWGACLWTARIAAKRVRKSIVVPSLITVTGFMVAACRLKSARCGEQPRTLAG